MKKKLTINGKEISVEVLSIQNDSVTFNYEGTEFNFDVKKHGNSLLLLDNTDRQYRISAPGKGTFLSDKGEFIVEQISYKASNSSKTNDGLISPLPGKIINILKKNGDAVEPGETVLVVEAMKMEHTICADLKGNLQGLSVEIGDTVAEGQQLGRIT